MRKVTEKDIRRIVENFINEGMSNDEAANIYRRIQQNSDQLDTTLMRLKGAKNDLDEKIKVHIRRETAGSIFDPNQRTPADVSDSIGNLNRVLNNLENILNEYKIIIRRSIN
jgi:hypothetical protein